MDALEVGVNETIFVGAHTDPEIRVANKAQVMSVRLRKGNSKLEKATEGQPKYEINKLSEIFQLIPKL
jgi:FMN phosphatase YigB (HAD superfamily)